MSLALMCFLSLEAIHAINIRAKSPNKLINLSISAFYHTSVGFLFPVTLDPGPYTLIKRREVFEVPLS